MDEHWEDYVSWLYCFGALLGIAFIVFLVNIRRPADAVRESASWISGFIWLLPCLAIYGAVLGVETITHHGGLGRVALAGGTALVCGALSAVGCGIRARVQTSLWYALGALVCTLAALVGLVLLGIALVTWILAVAG